MTQAAALTLPRRRADFLAGDGFESGLAEIVAAGAMTGGWLISSRKGAGKATLAFRIARALLNPDRPPSATELHVPKESQTFSLVASGGHPDLFVAEREYDEEKDRYKTEISIDSIRKLIHFLNLKPAMGGWRIAIVDTADELNRNSANALLKVLEEPPPRTAIFILAAAPGRLPATIRSRCRKLPLRPPTDEQIVDFLEREGAAHGEQAAKIAAGAKGRPGFALELAIGDGAAAIEAVDQFWSAAQTGGDLGSLAQRLALKGADRTWPLFETMLVERIAEAAANAAAANDRDAAPALVEACEKIGSLFTRGDAVNLDRYQMVLAAGRAFASRPG